MFEFINLQTSQLIGDQKLDIFKKRQIAAPITDFAMVLDGVYSEKDYYMANPSLENRVGCYWTNTICDSNLAKVITTDEDSTQNTYASERTIGLRPTMDRFSYLKFSENNIEIKESRALDGVLEIEYGEYPQKAAPQEIQQILNENFRALEKTNKVYTVDAVKAIDTDKEFEPLRLNEYLYNGKKYVRVNVHFSYENDINILSNNRSYENGDKVWIEVEPIKWLVDEVYGYVVSEKILLSGIQFDFMNNGVINIRNLGVQDYYKNYFSKEFKPSPKLNKTSNILTNKNNELKNAYEFNYENVTEEDLIRGSLESNIAPFLHGKSSEGKSARIKEFDPDAEIVYLRNATPDSLNGKSVYNAEKNEMIDVPPTWYVKLKEKCEAEPDKLHIVFFDELTNALPSIQGMAFNIILDKEINGKWKLPENARVAAAGNDLEDSLAANTMAEPLFNRFNHVYINTSVEDWLKWALTPNNAYERLEYKKEDTTKQFKIHPAIYSFIACKKESVLRTKYTGVKPNADPRKWEMASKVLYKTNNPYMLRGLIGEALTDDFAAFCKTKVISITDVIKGNYDEKIFEIDSSEKYLTTLALSNVDETNLEVVRKFVEKLGDEFLALFDSLWTIGDDERLEKLMDLKKGVSLCIKKK